MFGHLRDPAHWSLINALDWQARSNGDKTFVQMVDGEAVSFARMQDRSLRVAGHLARLGVSRGDHVILFVRDGIDFLTAWFGLGRLGAVAVLLNTELKGAFLRHQIRDSGARLIIIDAGLLPVLTDIAADLDGLECVVTTGAPDTQPLPFPRTAAFAHWQDAPLHDGPAPAAQDICSIMYTSGTTGPSKGVLMPHAHCFLYGLGTVDNLELQPVDRYYVTLPLYHANGLLMQIGGALIAGATVILRNGFSARAWLADIRQHGATVTNTLGVTAPFIFAQPPGPQDRDHKLRAIMAAPNPAALLGIWRERFGVKEVLSGFGMTECNIPIWGRPGLSLPPDCAGPVYDRYFEVEILDPDTDQILPRGTVGEIAVRPRAPFGFMAGYHGLPEKTVEAWRNLWFHTGDAGRMDENGIVTFIDRMRDCIRRRGHNISSFEIEQAFAGCAGVAEVAAIAMPSTITGGEDEVMICVLPDEGATLSPRQLAQHGEATLPRFALPRYIEIVQSLPKTPTGKVQKVALRKRGLPPGVWDSEAG